MTASKGTFQLLRAINWVAVAAAALFLASLVAGELFDGGSSGLLASIGLTVYLSCHALVLIVIAVGIRCPWCGGDVTEQTTRSYMDSVGPNRHCYDCGREIETM